MENEKIPVFKNEKEIGFVYYSKEYDWWSMFCYLSGTGWGRGAVTQEKAISILIEMFDGSIEYLKNHIKDQQDLLNKWTTSNL